MTMDETDADILLGAQYGDVFHSQYVTKKLLGRGVSSTVRKCIQRDTGQFYAVKIIDITQTESQAVKEEYENEVAILRQLSGPPKHTNIIEMFDFIETPSYFFMVFELCPEGELFDYLTKFVTLSEKKTRNIMRQILVAIQFIHDHGIVHRDIKPENILLKENLIVKISDFGMAAVINEKKPLTELCGTPGYMAPETLKCSMNLDCVKGYGKEIDLWACGVIMYTLLVGCPPFWHRRQVIMLRSIMEGRYSFGSPEWEDVSETAKDLIRNLLVVDPSERLTAKEALQHQFFQISDSPKIVFTPRKKFRAAVLAVSVICSLSRGSLQRSIPISRARQNPYKVKAIRKVIDTCAFGMYGHWVKKGEVQNRAALFEHLPKTDLKTMKENNKGSPNISPSPSFIGTGVTFGL
ncbi:phosphorylase b kinase gamma catalytic chain, liver/testis isoform-like [Patiria miniata]|uniref:phosphorylase kinase n=1 Tax=Patiria miniata TaxID=46514 RepID=A0A913ZYT1_PATMI|nr:phosphorylase b kinase gamma catalytic chain, liver/testis isoform-like [Patiria miniata]XP_038056722.1 phosphorylase b kinase gamma catalytic chain, liver/testis isoform-like [Patiria miniata]